MPQETQHASIVLAKSKKKTRFASSIVFTSSSAHVSVSQRTSCYRDACWNNETLSAKKEEYFLEKQGALGSETKFEINTLRSGALIGEIRRDVRDGYGKGQIPGDGWPDARRALGRTDEGSGLVEDDESRP